MPFDLTSSPDVDSILAEIEALRQQPQVRERLNAFSRYKAVGQNDDNTYDLVWLNGTPGDPRDGYYLANLVLQGGGTLGLAHAGFIAGLEQAGFRFPGIAGTSAGAIVVAGMFVLRGRNILNPVAGQLKELIDSVPMDTFVDGPRAIRRVVKRFAAGRSLRPPVYWGGLLAAFQRVLRRRGLNSGEVFEAWMKTVFVQQGIRNIEDLTDLAQAVARDLAASSVDAHHPFQVPGKELSGHDIFKIIATAMPTGSKFSLPRDLSLLHNEYDGISPAKLVRMSMSIPLFFDPVVMRTDPVAWRDYVAQNILSFVSDRTAREMADLKELTFLDGGLFSNLPTDELVDAMSDEIASISVPLVATETRVAIQNTNRPAAVLSDAAAVFNAVRLQRDRDAHMRIARMQAENGVKRHVVAKIDTGRANWLNFTMSDGDKDDLYVAGLLRARDLLKNGV